MDDLSEVSFPKEYSDLRKVEQIGYGGGTFDGLEDLKLVPHGRIMHSRMRRPMGEVIERLSRAFGVTEEEFRETIGYED